MPNARKKGNKIYSVPVDEQLQKTIQSVMDAESNRLGKSYNISRADVIRMVLEENCHRYLTGKPNTTTTDEGKKS